MKVGEFGNASTTGENVPRMIRKATVSIIAVSVVVLIGAAPSAAPQSPISQKASRTRVGIDVWSDRGFAPLAGKRIGLISNLTGRNSRGELTAYALQAEPSVDLVAIFSPEHGFSGIEEGSVESTSDSASGLPVHSLYGDTRRPTSQMLDGLDALVFDIQDIGTRFYTYATTMAYAMEQAAAYDLSFVVLDRPNPIAGVHVQGPLLDESELSFVGYAPVSYTHLTLPPICSV